MAIDVASKLWEVVVDTDARNQKTFSPGESYKK